MWCLVGMAMWIVLMGMIIISVGAADALENYFRKDETDRYEHWS